jgi:hypothetical protein
MVSIRTESYNFDNEGNGREVTKSCMLRLGMAKILR